MINAISHGVSSLNLPSATISPLISINVNEPIITGGAVYSPVQDISE